MAALVKAFQLHFLPDIEPEFEQVNAVRHDHPFEIGRFGEEDFKLRRSAEAHHRFHASPVIPGAVEGDEFARRGEMRHIALEIPLPAFGGGGFWQGDVARGTRVHEFADGEDGAALASRIAPFKDADDASAGRLQPVLQFDQLDLQAFERRLIFIALHAG
ncbi:hypothetical protein OHAE_354 [Ochrobactrum soli]|uniref:Uncharacterized protein n=1 Tax=Ochrobactrum soli TaxID=2448455 RepID=A0A2P9HK55_9HYPH|nr:hypothetical protein OHAE_354 [[Ochrobactrum] soli]